MRGGRTSALTGSNVATLEYSNADYPSLQAHVDTPATAGATSVSTDPVPYTFEETATDNPVTVFRHFPGRAGHGRRPGRPAAHTRHRAAA